MSEFPGNSRHEKQNEITADETEEPTRAEQVIFEGVIRREKPVGRKLVDLVSGVIKELAQDILVPALKDTARNFVTQGIDRALYRDDDRPASSYRHSSSRDTGRMTHRTDYNKASRDDRRGGRRGYTEPIDLDEVILKTHVQAEAVIEEMQMVLRRYRVVTIADLNHILGQDEASGYPDNNYGWTDLSRVRIRRIREGYLLVFPDPEDIK